MRSLVVLPTYNESENLSDIVASIQQHAPQSHILIVDDSSPDQTGELADDLTRKHPEEVFVIHRAKKEGLGRAYVAGFEFSLARGYGAIVQMDADFSHDPNLVPVLIDSSRGADVVIGSRYCRGGRVVNWPWHRWFLSRFANEYVACITGVTIRDSTSGFRCYTRRALQCLLKIDIGSEGYAFLVESIFHAQREGLSVVEVPITFVDRRAGKSKMSGKVIFESMLRPWRLRFGR